MLSVETCSKRHWDVVVVGTGFGGSSAGYLLAQAGMRVLFLEAGPESATVVAPESIGGKIDGRDAALPPLHSGAGGGLAVYAGTLERFRRSDFDQVFRQEHEGLLPLDWPITFDELLPHYRLAESLYRVHGDRDPLDPDGEEGLAPPPASARDLELIALMKRSGLNPYRLHTGINYQSRCSQCVGVQCEPGCNADTSSRMLQAMVEDFGANILFDCEATALEADAERITGIQVSSGGRTHRITAGLFILAAGSVRTPALLLRSVSPLHPSGVGNKHDVVGRGLMFHMSDFFSLPCASEMNSPSKTIGFSDHYVVNGKKLGSAQSTGIAAPLRYARIFRGLERATHHLPSARLRTFVQTTKDAAQQRYGGEGAMFATILEDLPYWGNRIWVEQGRIRFSYKRMPELIQRSRLHRRLLKERLGPSASFLGRSAVFNWYHVCGTCRMGNDPQTSVVDKSGKVHGLENLFLCDASVFSRSGGINPSLTVAANALRIGTELARAGIIAV